MTATELREWIKRHGLTHQEAADLLAMSRDGLRKNIYGQSPIGAQTARIVQLLEGRWPSQFHQSQL